MSIKNKFIIACSGLESPKFICTGAGFLFKRIFMNSFDYVNGYYGLNLKKGTRAKYDGRDCAVTRARGQYIYLKFPEDKKEDGPYHPMDKIEYLD